MESVQQQYEFNQAQNETFSDLARKMGFCGVFLIVCGVLAAIGGLATLAKGGVSNLATGVLYAFLGVYTNKAAKAFSLIVTSQGSDITNLMDAMVDLKKLYNLQYWLLIIALIFIALAMVLAIVAAAGLAGAGHP